MKQRFVTRLESALDQTPFDPNQVHSLHRDRPLWVRYDLARIRQSLTRQQLQERPETMWRYRELLPIGDTIEPVSLGERMTPLLAAPRLAKRCGLDNLTIKDESQLPGGSFKSRGMAMAITMAKHFGIRRVALPTAGNAGGAAAAYAARAGIECFVFMPRDTPIVNQLECSLFGAKVYLVDGLINDCGKIVKQGIETMNWFDLSTLKEPYRIEGKKTMGLELAEQCDWKLPDVILYPTGGGTGLIGMWKAFQELQSLGWLESAIMPRMVVVQSDGCAPIVRAFRAGERFASLFENAHTLASGLRVPMAVGDFMILDAVRESGGIAVDVDESRIQAWTADACRAEGISLCPESACCLGAIEQLLASGWLKPKERVVLFNTGAVQKYVEAIQTELPVFRNSQPIDWSQLEG
jgi:threonine synthase